MRRVLYINHKSQKCGVYEFGLAIGKLLEKSVKYKVTYEECDSFDEFHAFYKKFKPEIVVYNYHPSTLKWVQERTSLRYYKLYNINAIHIGTIHEVYQEYADSITNELFDFHVAADPTLLLKNPIVYKTGRLVPDFEPSSIKDFHIPVFGSFGFATGGKGFERIIDKVQSEFDEAVINLNISFSKYMDEDGSNARSVATHLKSKVFKPGIILNITHEHFTTSELQLFLHKNSMNMFLYDYQERRGISSTVDWALSVKRPVAITKSSMFRHLFPCFPSICIEDNTLKNILQNGIRPIEKYIVDWSPENLLWDYERIFSDGLVSKRRNSFLTKLVNWYKLKLLKTRISVKWESPWLKKDDNYIFSGFVEDTYLPIGNEKIKFNRLLNDQARELYKSTISFISRCCPELIKKKIPEANIQQAFVFDTAFRIAKQNKQSSKILSVGAFEDTAFISLQKVGFNIDGIDPVINYDIKTFLSKPRKYVSHYDVVISTSVIEHVEDDEAFIIDISKLLKVNGVAIITCDFNDRYLKGDDIPAVDFRFYTQRDLKSRLLSKIPNCKLLDEPKWDDTVYDFNLINRYNYTFATFVFMKFQE